MLTELYIEALLVDEELADQVWAAWDAGEIDDHAAFIAWWLVAFAHFHPKLLSHIWSNAIFFAIFDPI